MKYTISYREGCYAVKDLAYSFECFIDQTLTTPT